MTKQEKTAVIEELKDVFANLDFFYITDASTLSVEQINNFRRLCFNKGVKMRVIKNTLIRKALESASADKNYDAIFGELKGPTAVLYAEGAANIPAKVLKEFRAGNERPLLKAAYIDTAVFIGDDQLDALTKLKSKEQLLGEVIGLLQSPARNVISALQSGGQTIAGLVKTLQERA
ncbi:MAG: 50S ribosomal protein L10 [Bacteroidetes bacterium]|jgi:large subunit ribosomal protein L10|nr:50S ribosomal protein L10 [Bacteroidota bacterium]